MVNYVEKINKCLATLRKIALVRMRNVFEFGRSYFADVYRHVVHHIGMEWLLYWHSIRLYTCKTNPPRTERSLLLSRILSQVPYVNLYKGRLQLNVWT